MLKQYYYLIVGYNIHDLTLNESSSLVGPFDSTSDREVGLVDDIEDRSGDVSEVINITLMEIDLAATSPELVRTSSYTYLTDEYDDDD